MGGICSKPGTLEGGHQVIGTTRTLGGAGAGGEGDIRQAALDAAERRQREVSFWLVMLRCGDRQANDCIGTKEGDERGQSERGQALWSACVKEC